MEKYNASFSEIEKKFLKEFSNLYPINIGKEKTPFLILFDAIAGTGKSTVASIIAKETGAKILINDKIRQYLYRKGYFDNHEEFDEIVKKIQFYRLGEALRKNNNCILDGNISSNYHKKIEVVEKYKTPYYIIRLTCSEEIILDRLSKKSMSSNNILGVKNYSDSTADTYYRMKLEKYNIENSDIFYTIDTGVNIDQVKHQVDKMLEKLFNELNS